VRLDTGQSTNDLLPGVLAVGSNVIPGSPPNRIGSTTVAAVKVMVGPAATADAPAPPTWEATSSVAAPARATGIERRMTSLPYDGI
jgi:hypothetical protein